MHICARRGSGLAGRPACRRHALWYAIFAIRMREIVVFQCALIEDDRAEPRHQRQKLRAPCTELLEEFRGQARLPSMRAHSKTMFMSIYRCFFNISRAPRLTFFLSPRYFFLHPRPAKQIASHPRQWCRTVRSKFGKPTVITPFPHQKA